MTRAEIAANARKPYADAIRALSAKHEALREAARWILTQADKGASVGQLDLHMLRRCIEEPAA